MNENQLTSTLTPILEQCGLELEALETMPAGRRRLVRVVIDGDGPEGRGPTLDQITEATRAISTELDESEAVGKAAYTLEVTSRGLSRPLTEPKHWRRNTGRLVRVQFGDDGEPVHGRITTSDESTAELEVVTNQRKGLTENRTVTLAEVTRAVLVPELTKDDHAPASGKNDAPKKQSGKGNQNGTGEAEAAADTTEEN